MNKFIILVLALVCASTLAFRVRQDGGPRPPPCVDDDCEEQGEPRGPPPCDGDDCDDDIGGDVSGGPGSAVVMMISVVTT